MTTDGGRRPPTPESDLTPLWSAPLPNDEGGVLFAHPSGGCEVSTSHAVSAYGPDGSHFWTERTLGRVRHGSVLAADGAVLRIEGDLVVARDPRTGKPVGSFRAPLASGLCPAPWGGVIYSQANPEGNAVLRCVTRTGDHRWSVPLDRSMPLVYPPIAVADLVVFAWRGILWAIDADGRARWVAEPGGVRAQRTGDEAPRAVEGPEAGVWINDATDVFDGNRLVIELESYSDRGLYLLDAAEPSLTPVAVPSPARRPYAVLPWPPTGYRVVGLGGHVEVRRMEWEYPVVAIEPGGSIGWRHRLPAEAQSLTPAPGGALVAAATPSRRRWTDYGRWHDLSDETFVRCIDPDGTMRWTWYAPGRITHLPAVGPDGIVYVGCEQRLWALPTAPAPERHVTEAKWQAAGGYRPATSRRGGATPPSGGRAERAEDTA